MNTQNNTTRKSKILVIVGTVRDGRMGKVVADWYLKEASKASLDVELELLDIKALDLPIFSEATPPFFHQYSPTQEKLARLIGSAEGFVFITAEYNYSIPGSLKNFIDYLAAEWGNKAAAYVGYGTDGGIRAIEHLVQVMRYLRVANVGPQITIRTIWGALDENGELREGYARGDVAELLQELSIWARAMRQVRSTSTQQAS
jgi:NAD(P)H-dependent FMN reductase